jgi:hypothetical protein
LSKQVAEALQGGRNIVGSETDVQDTKGGQLFGFSEGEAQLFGSLYDKADPTESRRQLGEVHFGELVQVSRLLMPHRSQRCIAPIVQDEDDGVQP